MITLTNLTKKFGAFYALKGLNLTVPAGEIFGFIGPNGAGKTTTIRMMGGILKPTSGSVVIGGVSMNDHPEAAKQKIGFIPDRPYLYEKLTAAEFLRFTADLYGVGAAEFTKRAESLLEMFSLLDWAEELIESFSHGMRQRLIMAAALLHEPEVLIVDEPMVGLDPAGIRMVKELFKTMSRKRVSVFMSTHTLAVAEDLCHRIGIIHDGTLLATGTVDSLRRQASLAEADLEDIFMKLTEDRDLGM
jgi:ABC-2 type transport system ATP-binding protein